MTENIRPPRGFYDLLPEQFALHRFIISEAENLAYLYNFSQIQLPALEHAAIFNKSLGESSDVITKEIYHFEDKGGNILALRPEFTAGIMRSVLSNSIENKLPGKFFTHGPVFRYDRPQKGRQREFNQINFENIGASGAHIDAEMIKIACDLIKSLNLENKVVLEINSLGCAESRAKYNSILVDYFTKYEKDLSDESKIRLKVNPMRILDSKNPKDKEISSATPEISSSFTSEAKIYFEHLQKYLQNFNINYKINPRLVRGLDYYCHTIFEFINNSQSRQNTLIAGGRYDGLSKILGGKSEIPAVGFAGGIERIGLDIENTEKITSSGAKIIIMPIDAQDLEYSMNVAQNLRDGGLSIDIDFDVERNFSKRMSKSVKNNIKYIIFCGQAEREKKICRIKNIETRDEDIIAFEKMLPFIKKSDI